MIVLKKVLVATDFGSASESALRYAQALARGFGADLHVLHVVENILSRAMDGYGYAAISPEVQADIERAGRNQTEALLSDEDRRELQAIAATVTSNSPADAIAEYARKTGSTSSSWARTAGGRSRMSSWGMSQSASCGLPRVPCSPYGIPSTNLCCRTRWSQCRSNR